MKSKNELATESDIKDTCTGTILPINSSPLSSIISTFNLNPGASEFIPRITTSSLSPSSINSNIKESTLHQKCTPILNNKINVKCNGHRHVNGERDRRMKKKDNYKTILNNNKVTGDGAVTLITSSLEAIDSHRKRRRRPRSKRLNNTGNNELSLHIEDESIYDLPNQNNASTGLLCAESNVGVVKSFKQALQQSSQQLSSSSMEDNDQQSLEQGWETLTVSKYIQLPVSNDRVTHDYEDDVVKTPHVVPVPVPVPVVYVQTKPDLAAVTKLQRHWFELAAVTSTANNNISRSPQQRDDGDDDKVIYKKEVGTQQQWHSALASNQVAAESTHWVNATNTNSPIISITSTMSSSVHINKDGETISADNVIDNNVIEITGEQWKQAIQSGNVDLTQQFLALGYNINTLVEIEFMIPPPPIATVIKSKGHSKNAPLKSSTNSTNSGTLLFHNLHIAAMYNHSFLLSSLLQYGQCDVDVRDKQLKKTPLHFACENNATECIRILLTYGAAVECVDKRGESCLHKLVRHSKTSVLLPLLCERSKRSKLSINSKDREGCIALMYCESRESVMTLLSYGADPTIYDSLGLDSITHAARRGNAEILSALLFGNRKKTGSNKINKQTNSARFNRRNALHEAILHQHADCVRVLLEYGFDVNVLESDTGRTPITLAILNQDVASVVELLKYHPNMLVKDSYSYTAGCYAIYTTANIISTSTSTITGTIGSTILGILLQYDVNIFESISCDENIYVNAYRMFCDIVYSGPIYPKIPLHSALDMLFYAIPLLVTTTGIRPTEHFFNIFNFSNIYPDFNWASRPAFGHQHQCKCKQSLQYMMTSSMLSNTSSINNCLMDSFVDILCPLSKPAIISRKYLLTTKIAVKLATSEEEKLRHLGLNIQQIYEVSSQSVEKRFQSLCELFMSFTYVCMMPRYMPLLANFVPEIEQKSFFLRTIIRQRFVELSHYRRRSLDDYIPNIILTTYDYIRTNDELSDFVYWYAITNQTNNNNQEGGNNNNKDNNYTNSEKNYLFEAINMKYKFDISNREDIIKMKLSTLKTYPTFNLKLFLKYTLLENSSELVYLVSSHTYCLSKMLQLYETIDPTYDIILNICNHNGNYREVKCHMQIIAVGKFLAMIQYKYGSFPLPDDDDVIIRPLVLEVPDMTYQQLDDIIYYLYTGYIKSYHQFQPLLKDTSIECLLYILDLLEIAHYFLLNDLVSSCIEYLIHNLTFEISHIAFHIGYICNSHRLIMAAVKCYFMTGEVEYIAKSPEVSTQMLNYLKDKIIEVTETDTKESLL